MTHEQDRHHRAIQLASLIWLLIVGGLLGYGMASCLGEMIAPESEAA